MTVRPEAAAFPLAGAERVQLLNGPYRPPKLRRGQRTFCQYRGRTVVITGRSDGRLPWPRCRALGSRGGSGLLVEDELARAVRTESAAAVKHWWGVGTHAVWAWRQALGVDRRNNPGTRRLALAASAAGAAKMRDTPMPEAQKAALRERCKRLNLARFLKPRPGGRPWEEKELALLGTEPDEALAARFGRTPNAVRVMRTRRGVPTARDRRRREDRAEGATASERVRR
jgi:hypothetical protein